MNYIAMKDLKKTQELRNMLRRDRELILTKDGAPCALLIPVTPEKVEETLKAVRTALFSAAVSSARRKAAATVPKPADLVSEIRASRISRGVR